MLKRERKQSLLHGDRVIIDYCVKIHPPNCPCKFYTNKMKHRGNHLVLVAPCKEEDREKNFFLYNSMDDLYGDIELFTDNCLCTYSSKAGYNVNNAGIILINEDLENSISFTDTTELVDLKYMKLSDVSTINDKSKLINIFCEMMNDQDFFVLIGKNNSRIDDVANEHYSFPKGKIKYGESVEDCALREFTEETGTELPDSILNEEYQRERRILYDLVHNFKMPYEIHIRNFLMKIYFV
jgi:hypothetical protein